MLVFRSLDELKPYYHEASNTFVFNDSVTFEFNLDVKSHINARNINAQDINAWDINAGDINAWDINARNINAQDINAWDINAGDINAWDINAGDINAYHIKTQDINAYHIKALDISYHAVCFAYENITCISIQSRRDNHKHFVLDGEITIKQKEEQKKKVTLELTDEQLAKIKEIV